MAFSLKLELPSHPQVLCVVRSAVQQLAIVAGFPEEDSRSITLAVDEALTNIIRHAYENRHDQEIELTCRLLPADAPGQDSEGLEFVLMDHGRPVDPAELHGRPLGEVRPGGLGTHFIAQIMDQVHYEPLPGCNQLRLVKYLNKKNVTGG